MSFPAYLLSRITDLQTTRPNIQLKLTRVGVKNLKLSLQISSKHGSLSLFPVVDLFVDLPSDKRGVHLSRDPECLHEILQEQAAFKVRRIEDFCEIVAKRLLEKHKYANRAEVRLRSDYMVIRQPPGMGDPGQEPCKIFAMATATRNDDDTTISRMVGAKVVGFTTCPCTQGLLKALSEEKLRESGWKENDIKKIMASIPIATHSQRTKGRVLIEVPVGHSVNVEDLVDIVEDSMSERTYAVLKRPAEASVVERGHTRARFGEDVVREILWALAERYPNFPDEVRVFAQAYSEESVHKHDIIAERTATLGEIRSEIGQNE